jgi:hypothetical protein
MKSVVAMNLLLVGYLGSNIMQLCAIGNLNEVTVGAF